MQINVPTVRALVGNVMMAAAMLPLGNALAEVQGKLGQEEETTFQVPRGQRQLFLDDYGIAKIENLDRVMHQPDKRGAVIRSVRPEQSIQTRTAPIWDPQAELFKFWVLGIDDTFWQSADGLHWTPGPKPNMRTDMVVYDPNDPDPARRFKAPLLNEGFAVSPNGFRWTQLEMDAIPSSDEGNFSFNAKEGLFIHSVKRGGTHGRAVALATSPDFHSWVDHGIVFQTDKLDQKLGIRRIEARQADPTLQQTLYNDPQAYHVDVYNMGIFRYEGCYIGLPALYHATGPVPNYPNTDGFHIVQLACSRDLKQWTRLGDRQPFLRPSRIGSGAYDLTQILPPSAPLVRDDELWFYYTGLKYRCNWTYVGTYPSGTHVPLPGLEHDVGAVCLAVLRRDGFISLDAGEQPGSVTTEPFRAPGGRLFVNFNAQNGQLRVEALNDSRDIVAQSAVLQGDHRRAEVVWDQGDLASLRGEKIVLRFTSRKAQFYSYWFGEKH